MQKKNIKLTLLSHMLFDYSNCGDMYNCRSNSYKVYLFRTVVKRSITNYYADFTHVTCPVIPKTRRCTLYKSRSNPLAYSLVDTQSSSWVHEHLNSANGLSKKKEKIIQYTSTL